MDKALTWQVGSQGSNLDTAKKFRVPILSGALLRALSLTMPVVTFSSVNTCHVGGKKRGIMVKIIAAPSVGQNKDIRMISESSREVRSV